MLLNGLGRFQNALGAFQEAPERESLIFHWFWKVFGGVRPRTGHARAVWLRPPKLKENTKHTWLGQMDKHQHKGQGKHKHKGMG